MGDRQGRLDGRRIVITGAAGGIGRATAELFMEEGARVALLDRPGSAIDDVGAALGSFAMACDVSQPDQVASAIAAAEAALGGLDGAINAAGMLRIKPFEDSTLADWTSVVDVNLTGTMLICQAVVPALRRAGHGTIVNIASIAAIKPPPASAAYAVSKAGVLMLSRCLANELGPDIRVNSICPGTIETVMTADLRQDNAIADRLANMAAAKRFGTPREVAQALLFLTGEESAFITGAALGVDGGALYH